VSRFDDLSIQHGFVIRSAWIEHDVHLTIRPGGRVIITYCSSLSHAYARLAVETMVEVVDLVRWGRWEGSRFGFRYPLADDSADLGERSRKGRRDYRIPERRARRRLIPDALLDQAERECWDWWMLIEATDLNDDICHARWREWKAERPGIIYLPLGDLDGAIPF
jgi:hypothetical protein